MTLSPALWATPEARAPAELPLDLTWTAPDGCPTRSEVLEELSQAVTQELSDLPPLSARAIVEQRSSTFHLELITELDGQRGVRLFEADTCEGLARAATLVLALTIGEGLARRQAEAGGRNATEAETQTLRVVPPEPAPLAAATHPRPVDAPPLPPQREPSRVLLWAAVGVGSDALGAFGPALALGGAHRSSLLRLGARIETTLPRSSEFVAAGAELGSFGVSAALEICLAPALNPLEFSVCANGAVTLLEVRGEGTARDGAASVPLYGVGPGVNAAWLVSEHAFLSAAVVSRFLLTRPELVVEGLSQRRRIEAASVQAELGAGVRW